MCAGCGLGMTAMLGTDGRTGYRSPCGCRTRPIDATTIDGLVEAALSRRGLLPNEPARVSAGTVGLTVEVYIGTAYEDIVLVVNL